MNINGVVTTRVRRAGADGVRHRALRGVVRGVHRELRARGAARRRARQRAAQPQDARSVPAGRSPSGALICHNCLFERKSKV